MKNLRCWLLVFAVVLSANLAWAQSSIPPGPADVPYGQDSSGNYWPASPSHPLTVNSAPGVGAANAATNQVSVGTSATLIVAARTGAAGTGRIAVTVKNNGTAAVFIGMSSSVTTGNGFQIDPGGALTLYYTGAVYGIVAAGTQSVGYAETY